MNAVVTLVLLGAVSVVCLFFPKALAKLYRAVVGESYARLLNPISVRALGVLFAILFDAVLFGMLQQYP